MKIVYPLIATVLLVSGCGTSSERAKALPKSAAVANPVAPVPQPGSNEEAEKILESDDAFFSEGKSKDVK